MKASASSAPAVTRTQKTLHGVMFACSLLLAYFRVVMSLAGKVILSNSVTQPLSYLLTGAAALAIAAYAGYMLLLHPDRKAAASDMLKRFGIFGLLAVFMLVWSLAGWLLTAKAYPSLKLIGENKTGYIDFALGILVLLPLGEWLGANRERRVPRTLTALFVFTAAAAAAYLVYCAFSGITLILSEDVKIGMDGNLSLRINCNRNTTGIIGSVLLMCSVCMAFTSGKRLRALYAVSAAVFFMIVTLSQSRTSIITVCGTLGIAAGFYIADRSELPKERPALRWLFGIVAAAVTALALIGLRTLIFRLYLGLTNAASSVGIIAGADIAADGPGMRGLDEAKLNGRLGIWKASLRAMVYDARSFMFGVTPYGVYLRMGELLESGNNLYTHNQFLQMGVAYGVPVLIAFVWFTAIVVKDCVKTCFTVHRNDFREMLVPLFLFLLYLGNMTEATLFGGSYISGEIFIILCGYVHARAKDR